MVLPCKQCIKVEEEGRQKVRGPGCERCTQRKVGCSVVGLKRKGSEKRAERRVTEDVDKGPIAPLELSDRVMEQVEVMAKELRNISGGIWALVEGIGRLTEAVEGMGKKEVRKVDKETEMEEDSKEEEESEEEEEEEKKGDDREESESESDATEDGEKGEKK
jgi:hypothetical protein